MTLKMIFDKKTFNIKVVRLVETIDFDINIVPIQVRMQKLELSECSPVMRRDVARPTRHMSDG